MNFLIFFLFCVTHLTHFTTSQHLYNLYTNGSEEILKSVDEDSEETTLLDLRCNFLQKHYGVAGDIYQCTINYEIKSEKETRIQSISGAHDSFKNNKDVEGFKANHQSIHYFPKGLENYFRDIKLIHMQYGLLKRIRESDFEPFPDLVEINFHDNDIKVIEKGIFDHNKKLQYISFSNNKIQIIHSRVFDKLNDLHSLYLNENECIDTGAYRDEQSVKNIIKLAKKICKDDNASSEEVTAENPKASNISQKTLNDIGESSSNSMIVKCIYDYNYYDAAKWIDMCEIYGDLNIQSKEATLVNFALRPVYNIKGFVANEKSARYFPKGLENYFKLLKLIHMKNCKLQEIHQSDLKPYIHLVEIDLEHNEIEIIEEGLFEYNLKLELVSFSSNKITQMHPEVFDNLKYLHSLYLYDNRCIHGREFKDAFNVKKLINEAKKSCTGIAETTQKPEELQNFIETSTQENISSESKGTDSFENDEADGEETSNASMQSLNVFPIFILWTLHFLKHL